MFYFEKSLAKPQSREVYGLNPILENLCTFVPLRATFNMLKLII